MKLSRPLQQTIASSLIAFQALALAGPLARATAMPAARLRYQVSLDIPYHGAIDLHHNAYTRRDHVSNSLYLLRNTAIEDLLNTRRGIKALIGGAERARKTSGKKSLSFEVPAGVLDLYLVGDLGAASSSSSANPELVAAIHDLGSGKAKYDADMRAQVLLGLVHVTAQIAKLDQALKFVDVDYWENKAIKFDFYQLANTGWNRWTKLGGAVRDQWMKDHGAADLLATLQGHREYLLDRYHLLAVEVEGKPLYRHLYQAMQGVGFPRADMIQKPVQPRLLKGNEPFTLPNEFDQAVERAFEMMGGGYRREIFDELKLVADAKIDKALLRSLESNSERLQALTRDMDYDGSRSSPLLELARYGELWDAAAAKYEYLGGLVDFKRARQEIESYFARRADTERKARYAAYGAGIGIGVVGIAVSWAPALASSAAAAKVAALTSWAGIPMRAWLVGSGLISAGQASYDYVQSRDSAKMAKGLFLGTVSTGSRQRMADAVSIAEDDYYVLVGSLLMLGIETRALHQLLRGAKILKSGGKAIVRVARPEIEDLQWAFSKIADRAEAMAPMGRALIAGVRGLLGMASPSSRFLPIEDAIAVAAKRLRMAPAAVRAKLESSQAVGAMIRAWRVREQSAKILMNPSMVEMMVSHQANNIAVSLATEYLARGDKMLGSEFGDFVNDMAQGLVITFALDMIGAPIAPQAREAVYGAAALKGQSAFWNSGTGQFVKKGRSNFLVGLTINGSVGSLSEAIHLSQDGKELSLDELKLKANEAGKNALWGGLTLGISSTSRYQFVSWLEGYIARKVAAQPQSRILIQSAWTANNLFGGWSYVTLGQATGFLNSEGEAVQPDPATHYPEEGETGELPELDSRITRLRIEKIGGAYLKIEGNQGAAEYVFDFLRNGPDAP